MAEYIEREAAVRKALDACVKVIGHGISQIDAVDIADAIDSIPTADVVEERHGYWDDNIIGFCNVCMECGAIVERTAIKSHTGALNYCPNCGADMRGVEK